MLELDEDTNVMLSKDSMVSLLSKFNKTKKDNKNIKYFSPQKALFAIDQM